MLPDIPDNDTATCWAPECTDPSASCTGLCFVHFHTVAHLNPYHPTGRIFDLLGLRLNVLQETRGACLRAAGPCDMKICRFHLDDHKSGASQDHREPCAIQLASRGGMILDDIAKEMGNVTRERVRQMEVHGLRMLKRACERAGIRLADVVGRRRAA